MYLLRRNPQAFGLNQFSIIDRDDQLLMFRLLRGKDKDNVLPKAAELCDLYSYARNTQSKLSEALIKQLPDAYEHKTQIAELMKTYEQRKRERNFFRLRRYLVDCGGAFTKLRSVDQLGCRFLSGIAS